MTKRMTAGEMRKMVGCSVSYKGREGIVERVRPDLERSGKPSMMIRMTDTGLAATIRPSELA